MMFLAVAVALLFHVCFWGLGAAMLLMPRRWDRFWPMLVIPAGLALQSLVVWLGAYAGLPGTNSYAWPAEILPAFLLGLGLRRLGIRRARVDVTRFGLVYLITLGVLLLLLLPLGFGARGLTTISLGSCDAADYAAGARVFQEFARGDRAGFLGLTEVVRVMSADNFADFWLRLNHFTPSALMALNGTILDCGPHEIVGVLTLVVLAGTVPVVFWVARAMFRYSGVASLVIAGLYGISPITWYSVAHVSPAPQLAAIGIALLSWAGFALWNGRLTWRTGWALAGVLAVAYALLLGSYNFILLVALVPAVAYAGGWTLRQGCWARLARWAVIMLAPLLACGLVFWGRVSGLVERFLLFQTYDFGWRIPALGPEGWLGMVRGGSLLPWPWFGVRWLLGVAVITALSWGVARSLRERRWRVWLVLATTLPVLLGYAFLEVRGVLRGTNASYDAFKLFTVFYPLLLCGFCWWITLRWSMRLFDWIAVASFAGVVVTLNLVGCAMSVYHLWRAPLRVDGELRQLRRIEAMPDVASVNLLIPDMWSRLWANAFLLQKPQYFLTHTYEGRLNTSLRGEWDLSSEVVRVQPGPAAARRVTPHYWLTDTRAPGFVRVLPERGWHALETLPGGERWRWTAPEATLRVQNPQSHPVALRLELDGRGEGAVDLGVALAGGPGPTFVRVPGERGRVPLPAVTVPPGESVLVLRTRAAGGAAVAPADDRALGVCVFALVLEPAR
ncbi:hypothetical protein [Opitutus sp. ER46]|uniref:hypothetical protein n=1 Tax=Opitutus sp. ER46 TaxID=2161864 RepID=UPI000D31438A|nr:hypothetical protein [Opitutus sp. ER46]PTX97729.1 hypothetical protein DB354_05460 [Opitutus sp. ER46]